MEYVRLGQSDLVVSRMGLGTWAIGESDWGQYDEGEALAAINAAIAAGINFIDTAPVYGRGKAEELVGAAIKDCREKVIVATKCGLPLTPHPFPDLSPDFIEADLEGSLRRLGTDYIDLYQCHWPDPKTPVEETAEALLKFQAQGKIRHIGLSNFSAEDIEAFSRLAPVTTVQAHYSLLERKVEEGILPRCMAKEIPILTYGSLGGGMLTGKFKSAPQFVRRDPRAYFYRFQREGKWSAVKALTEAMGDLAKKTGKSPTAQALAWLLARPGVGAALVGARTPSQILENIQAAEECLSASDLETLTTLSDAACSALTQLPPSESK